MEETVLGVRTWHLPSGCAPSLREPRESLRQPQPPSNHSAAAITSKVPVTLKHQGLQLKSTLSMASGGKLGFGFVLCPLAVL